MCHVHLNKLDATSCCSRNPIVAFVIQNTRKGSLFDNASLPFGNLLLSIHDFQASFSSFCSLQSPSQK